MSSPEVEFILGSVSRDAPPITTLRLRYWRGIHSEFLTHRAFTRNASSSRAIPVSKLVSSTEDNIFVPEFRKNQKGMQAGPLLHPMEQEKAEQIWRSAAEYCLYSSQKLAELGVHKQWANRPLEWFGYINVLVTATEWDNFFELRTAIEESTGWPIPQDEMFELAYDIQMVIQNAEDEGLYQNIPAGQWHIPYVTKGEKQSLTLQDQLWVSAARCASISYQTVDGKEMTVERARELGQKLAERKHWSPFEHQAKADCKIEGAWAHRSLHANYTGWAQSRHIMQERS